MSKTQTETRQKQSVAEEPKSAGAVATQESGGVPAVTGLRLRLPYPKNWCTYHGVTVYAWRVLIDAVWPSAKTVEAVCMAIAYCKARGLDPMKKPVHIVPVYSKAAGGEVETVWPAITEVRITATRTGVYAGKDAIEVGPVIKRTFTHTHDNKTTTKEVEFPEWMRLTVYKIVAGQRCAFVGPKVFWIEAYASQSKWSEVPNDMWQSRPSGQLEKCAEAASLRAAFPEELGDAYVPEEMAGRTIEGDVPGQPVVDLDNPDTVAPRENRNSEFKPAERTEAEVTKPREEQRQAQARAEAIDVVDESQDSGADPADEVQPAAEDDGSAKEYEAWFEEQIAALPGKATIPQLSKLRNDVSEQLAPGSDYEKRWLAACSERQREILDATRKK